MHTNVKGREAVDSDDVAQTLAEIRELPEVAAGDITQAQVPEVSQA
jgi:thiamine monophosphate synthase